MTRNRRRDTALTEERTEEEQLCPNCGAALPDEAANFCSNCGAELPGETASFCSNCGAELPDKAVNFCPNCGAEQDLGATSEEPIQPLEEDQPRGGPKDHRVGQKDLLVGQKDPPVDRAVHLGAPADHLVDP